MSVNVFFNYVNEIDVKVQKIVYSNSDTSIIKKIDAFAFRIAKDNNIWKSLEKYRKYISNSEEDSANTLFEEKKSKLYSAVNEFTNPFSDFDFDTFIAFYPKDENRNKLLEHFVNTITRNVDDFNTRDKSTCFEKIDKSKSVTEGLTINDFTLETNSLKGMKKLLLADDVIDRGRTINILLDKFKIGRAHV